MECLTFPRLIHSQNRDFWPLSSILLRKILADETTDQFVAALVWERLGYLPGETSLGNWHPSTDTPSDWKATFPKAPEIIAQRKASVCLTRSIPKKYKQLLKEELKFSGYSIGELYPRRTRRATAVNWLLAWGSITKQDLLEKGAYPPLSLPPENPAYGHQGDPTIQ